MRIALYGGAFNPPHVGHLLAATWVLATAEVDRLWLMPTYRHPFGKPLAPFADRVELCLRVADLFARDVDVTTVESEVGGEGRTVDTLEYLQRKYPDDSFRLVIGTDILDELPKWKRFDRVAELAPPILVARGGHPHPSATGPAMPDVSSTEVRRRLAAGEDASELVPRVVLEYVQANGLYRA